MKYLLCIILLLPMSLLVGAMDMVDSLLMVHANDSSILALGPANDYSVPDWVNDKKNFKEQTGDTVVYKDNSLVGKINRLHERMTQPYDTVHDSGYWKRALSHGNFGVINDPSVKFPKFLDFLLRIYRWGDKTFNSYDTTYVKPTGKNFKVMFKVNNWFDSYYAKLADTPGRFVINGQVATNIGFRFSFMAVGFEYMPDLDNLLFGEPIQHRKTRISFTCSRIQAELYYFKNDGLARIHKFGPYEDGKWLNLKYYGLSRKTLGVDLFYFFNYKKYAHAAAYCFSKYQLKSAGSFVAGLQYTDQKVYFDFSELPADMIAILPEGVTDTSFHYYDYGINVGYAYNLVLPHNWLLNFMLTPSIGIRHGIESHIDGPINTMFLDTRFRMACDYNCKNFYYSFLCSLNTNWYHTQSNHLFTNFYDFTLVAGYRF